MTSSLKSYLWNMFLMTNEFDDYILEMICSNFYASMTVSGLMRAIVKGWLICLGSNSCYSISANLIIKLYYY